jgi:flagellar protein FlaG
MTQPQSVKVNLVRRPDYRENYANSVQMRVNLWDFYLEFGTVTQTEPEVVNIETFQGIYLSPQQAKALFNVLQQNITQYETTFGEIKLDPKAATGVVQ